MPYSRLSQQERTGAPRLFSTLKEHIMEVKILGNCCAICRNTATLIEQVAKAKGTHISLTKVDDIKDIMSYGVMSVPGVVIDGKLVHAGGMPSREKVEMWFTDALT
ncbi:MAG TPA: thioredoxin family protein [Noviherbaspirillum sp.]